MNRELFFENDHRNYLLVIGINEYQDKQIPTLKNAAKDAKDVRKLLVENYEFDASEECCIELYDANASKKHIVAALQKLAKEFHHRPNEFNLLIYFAGHGHLDKLLDIGYLLPADAKHREYDSYLPNSTIIDYISRIKSHHTFLILDSCFSGSLLRSDELAEKSYTQNQDKYPSRIGLTSGRLEVVADGYYNDNSPFAKALIQFLKVPTSPVFTTSDLYNYLKTTVPNNANQQPYWGRLLQTGDLQG
ncbi:MAG: caspase domain-containing protein, partial [Bacteroidia bacterium]